ncbi:MAG TPA: DedA family protein [Bryobacteraceae bacterium]|nr:DedA family protein [Bryobacteraceae bacterium]
MGEWIVEIVAKLGYVGVFLLTLLENIFPPIPSELVMPLAGYHAAQGRFGLVGAIAAGSAGSVLGTIAWYWLGRHIGEKRLRDWADRRGKWLTLDGDDIDSAAEWFHRRGIWAVFVCRLIPGLRTWISLPAGFSEMPMRQFLAPTILGTVLWTSALTVAGHLLGQNYNNIDGVLGTVSWVVIASIALMYVFRLIQRSRPGVRSKPRRANSEQRR